MPALITTLIDKLDNAELICNQIGAILLLESTNQQALALAAHKDPKLWKLRVFTEQNNAWEQFQSPPDASNSSAQFEFDDTPIVNVSFDQANFDPAKGDMHERQAADGSFFIDCFGLGIAADDPNGPGYFAGDALAAVNAKRAARLVRNILMAAAYITLGFPLKPNPVIWGGRRVQSIQMSTVPDAGERIAQNIVGARLTLAVTFNEFSPQIEAVPLELVSTSFTRSPNGELVFIAADFPISQE